ncbi:hypothetical protein BFW01_g10809 [Lasiodiplodia theobromae]|uniref:Uncharacterized protein n=1 Tax=Lasiodiplodia theobromae TaxID=45133 RepID=A0A8H7IQ91_9PEZI|nr:hypothetical protein BFW01_g10809 [Lasiodiplodia theobromae]
MPTPSTPTLHRFNFRETEHRRSGTSYQEVGSVTAESEARLRRRLQLTSQEHELERRQTQELKIQVERLQDMVKYNRAGRKRAERQLTEALDTVQDVQATSNAWKSRCDFLEQSKEQSEKKLESCMSQLRQMQLSSFQQVQSAWSPEEDQSLRELIMGFYKSIRLWATTYSIESFAEIIGTETEGLEALLAELGSVSTFTDLGSLINFEHPFLFTAALLSTHLYDHIFNNPFFVIGASSNLEDGEKSSEALKELFFELSKVQGSSAQKWRAQLLRDLFPRPREAQPGKLIDIQGVSRNDFTILFEEIMDSFHCGYAGLLLRPDDESKEWSDCLSELENLVIEAVNLYARVQTQSAFFEWDVPGTVLGQPFTIDSPMMRPDRFHRLEDEEDRQHDGKLVKIVLNPTVRIYGDHDGDNLNKSRVLVKAAVYLEDDSPSTPEIKVEDQESWTLFRWRS